MWAAALLVGSLLVLGFAIYLRPDSRGYGTHEQFGMTPCGWLLVTDYPCPTCGMTTAFAYTVRGQWVRAFLAQPGGFVGALATVLAVPIGLFALWCGRWPRWLVRVWLRVSPLGLFYALLSIFLGGWILNLLVGLLLHRWPAG